MAKKKSTPKKNTKELLKETKQEIKETTPKEENKLDTSFADDNKKKKKEKVKKEVETTPVVKEVETKPVEEKKEKIKEEKKSTGKASSIFLYIICTITIIAAFGYFFLVLLNTDTSITGIITSSMITLFSLIFLILCITTKRKKKFVMILSSLLLLSYFGINIAFGSNIESYGINKVDNFTGKNLTDVVKWANDNHINLIQDYEYSDMVPEYQIISQDVKSGTSIKDINEITVSVSEGPNPQKEVVVPSMLTWDAERVVKFIKTNYLNNVSVEFVDSDQMKDTVIDQNISGNIERDDELKLVFSFGENPTDTVELIDFTDFTKFEAEFYLIQHRLNYNFDYKYSSKIKKGNVISQSINPGTSITSGTDTIDIVLSKGPKIKVPELKDMSVTEITEWAIKNKLKLEFNNKYDDTVKKGKVITTSVNKDEIIEQGTTIKVDVSLGNLKMPKFKDLDAFYKWADKYGIKYEEEHEFSDSVPAGEVIKYSHKTGDTIKNDETIKVTISDGQKKKVPNVVGLTKSAAASKLKDAGFNYNFVYQASNSVQKDKVISQSISAGSEVSTGTTVTVVLSNGKKESSTKNYDSGRTSPSGGNVQPVAPTPTPSTPDPTPTCNQCTIYGIKGVVRNNLDGGYDGVANALTSHIQGQCPGIKVIIYPVSEAGTPGMFASGDSDGSYSSCGTINIGLAK